MRLGFISTVHLYFTPADRGEIVVFSNVKCACLALISIVNLHVTPACPLEIVVFFNEKCALYQPPEIRFVFSGKMRRAFLVTVSSCDKRPTAPGRRIFFQLKRASRKPFQILCVFSSKTRLALNVIGNL